MSLSGRRRVRRVGGRLIRRLGLLPDGDPDGLGDDAALRGQSLPFRVMVYFPDTPRNLYQLRQWYGTLRALDERHRVGIVCLDSRTASMVRSESRLPVVCCARIGTLEDLVSHSDVALALYVNHNIRNLNPLRFTTMLHAYLGHGESDKAASASNQVKAYDVVLVAGRAAYDRLARNLLRYDAAGHVVTVGRPTLDNPAEGPTRDSRESRPRQERRPTVLYAPTWEGAQPSMAYSSVVSHGDALLRSLLESHEWRVVYRPHPRTGANNPAFAQADQRLRTLVRDYASNDAGGHHTVDTSEHWDVRRDPADLLVSDVSAVAADWMTSGKPLIVTVPVADQAFLDTDTVLNAVPGLLADQAGHVAELVRREMSGGDAARRRAWVQRAMGEVSAGASTARFLAVCDELVGSRDSELAARTAGLAGEPA